MVELPAPLTPSVSDLRGMPYMPLDLVRLFESDLYMLSSGDEFKAALTLWGRSFYQIPAGSLPDDDRLLAHLSGAKRWSSVKKMALRGWVKCADGRLYHATVAQKVAEAWAARLARRARTEAARAARRKADDMTESVTEIVIASKGTEQIQTEVEVRSEDSESGFARFWQFYPRKVGKGQARRAWHGALRKTTEETIFRALELQKFDSRERFQPHPATWLNGERWLDEAHGSDPVLRAAGVELEDMAGTDSHWSLLQ